MKCEQVVFMGHALRAIYNRLEGKASTEFLQNIARLDNIMHTGIANIMTNNWTPNNTKHSYSELGMEPYLGDTVYFRNSITLEYEKGVIIDCTKGFLEETYICKVNVIESNTNHYVDTENMYLNYPEF